MSGMMLVEEIMLKFIENAPALALLAIVIILNEKRQICRDAEATKEREAYLAANRQFVETIHSLSPKLETLLEAQRDFMELVTTAHQYQKMEHEQMIKLIEKMI